MRATRAPVNGLSNSGMCAPRKAAIVKSGPGRGLGGSVPGEERVAVYPTRGHHLALEEGEHHVAPSEDEGAPLGRTHRTPQVRAIP